MRKLLFLFPLFVFLSAHGVAQQVEYHYFDTREGIRIEYRWSRANLFDRNSDAVLFLQMTNTKEVEVKIVYGVGFYRDDVLILEGLDNVLCLKPGQRRRGSRTDMRFSAPGINMPMVDKDWFSWDIVDFIVVESGCE